MTIAPCRSRVVAELTTEMTAVQRSMYIAGAADIYRLPFILEAPSSDPKTCLAALRDAVSVSPLLCARYRYDASTERFLVTYGPELVDALELVDVGHVDDLHAFCADPTHRPTMATGLPLSAYLVEHAGHTLLVLEFHHIAIDGLGIAAFTSLLRGEGEQVVTDPAHVFGLLEQVAEVERTCSWVPSDRDRTADHGRSVRETRILDIGRETAGLRLAVNLSVEAALARRIDLPGMYAFTANWRPLLGLPEIVANLPAMVAVDLPTRPTQDRASELMRAVLAPPGPGLRLASAPEVIVSFERLGMAGEFVPVDSVPKAGLYLRAVSEGPRLILHADYPSRRFPTDTISDLLDDLTDHLQGVLR